MTRSSARRRPERLLSGALTLVVLIGGGYLVWQVVGSNLVSGHRQQTVVGAMQDVWSDRSGDADDDPLHVGEAFAILRIPRFGPSFEVPVVHGVVDDALASGVGHFPDTARPGQVGNFAVAGHRVSRGQPFADFPSLQAGDTVVVETRTHVFTYVLENDGTEITVDYTDTTVIRPVPRRPRAKPERALITLVTCAELFRTDDRSVVHGHLVSSVPA